VPGQRAGPAIPPGGRGACGTGGDRIECPDRACGA
jgi:hypothetical protein